MTNWKNNRQMEQAQEKDDGNVKETNKKGTTEPDGGVKYQPFYVPHLLKNQIYCWNLTFMYNFMMKPASMLDGGAAIYTETHYWYIYSLFTYYKM